VYWIRLAYDRIQWLSFFCEYGNKPSDSPQGWKFLDQLADY
jgi:hypothetical protein